MNTQRRRFAAGALAAAIALPAGIGMAQSTNISIATGGTGGVYFPLGVAMAEEWSQLIEGLGVTAESTGASVVNMRLVQAGDAELAIVQNDVATYAREAIELFEGDSPLDASLGMAVLYPEPVQIVTLAGTGITTIDDLAGRSVAIGAPGSGAEANARQILQAHGITYDDITEQYLSFAEAVDALRDGRVEAAFVTAGVPTAAVVDLDSTHDVVIVGMNDDDVAALGETWPFYAPFTIEAGTYAGVTEDVQTVTVLAMIVASQDLDADLVEQMLEVLYSDETMERLCNTHVRGCDITLETALDGMPIPLHPGAEAFYARQ